MTDTGERLDGARIHDRLERVADFVVVGSGPAGSSFAREVARHGASVLVVEAGRWFGPQDFPVGAFGAMAQTYRAMGTSVALGRVPTPYVQGRMVGGSSPINGAICWRLPDDVLQGWVERDPALQAALPRSALARVTDALEARLGVAPTEAAVAGRKSTLMARGAAALGLEHRPIRRNVRGCVGAGRCLQGCPHGRKQSVDVTLLADALADGAVVLSDAEIGGVRVERGRAVGVVGRTAGGAHVELVARRAVVLAASAVQSPALLLRSGVRHGPVGRHFQCHPGVSLAGRFDEPVRMWEGATQGHEVTGLRHEGLKFETLGFGLALLGARLDGVGGELARRIGEMEHWLDWGVAVRARAEGRVRVVAGRTLVFWSPDADDVRRYRRGLRVLGEMMLAAGATEVSPGVRGFEPTARDVPALVRLERDGPRSPRAYPAAITHMFGTCRMGSDPARSVVRPDFRHHTVDGLLVVDSSVFPSNLGVNPQLPIMAVATLAGRRAVGADLEGNR